MSKGGPSKSTHISLITVKNTYHRGVNSSLVYPGIPSIHTQHYKPEFKYSIMSSKYGFSITHAIEVSNSLIHWFRNKIYLKSMIFEINQTKF